MTLAFLDADLSLIMDEFEIMTKEISDSILVFIGKDQFNIKFLPKTYSGKVVYYIQASSEVSQVQYSTIML